jgi:transcriptional regulator with XRE-family HTH domain
MNETEIQTMEGPPKPRHTKAQSGRAKPTLGSLLSALRARNGWTLKEMSERTGIPFSTLSKVEHDKLTLSYDKLQQLGERLNMRMSDLFAEPEDTAANNLVTARRSVGSFENGLAVRTDNYDYRYLFTDLRRKRMVPLLSRIRAKSIAEFGDLVRHSGEEWTYVVEGQIVLHTEFYEPLLLEKGECVYIDSSMGHAYILAEGCDTALVIGACASASEDHMDELLGAHGEQDRETT